jgi:hypothetical protein
MTLAVIQFVIASERTSASEAISALACHYQALFADLYHEVARNLHIWGGDCFDLPGTLVSHLYLPSRTSVPPVFAAQTVRRQWRRYSISAHHPQKGKQVIP